MPLDPCPAMPCARAATHPPSLLAEHTAACAVRYVLRHELGNYIQQDLKIVTGRGLHSQGEPLLLHRIQKLLGEVRRTAR
jgi:hypothetical protein